MVGRGGSALVATAYYGHSHTHEEGEAPSPILWAHAVIGSLGVTGLIDALHLADGFEAVTPDINLRIATRREPRDTMLPQLYEAVRIALAGASAADYQAARERAAAYVAPERTWIAFLFADQRPWVEAATDHWLRRAPIGAPDERWCTHGDWLLASAVDLEAARRLLERRLTHRYELDDQSWAFTLLQRFGEAAAPVLELAADIPPYDELVRRLRGKPKPRARKPATPRGEDAIDKLPRAPRDKLVRAIRKAVKDDAENFELELDATIDDTGELAEQLLQEGARELQEDLGTVDDAVRAAAIARYREALIERLNLDPELLA